MLGSRLVWHLLMRDVDVCGSDHLPDEGSIIGSGCYASVSVLDAESKRDQNVTFQAEVFARLQDTLPLVCLD